MKVDGKNYRTVWMDGNTVMMVEQNKLPFEFRIHESVSWQDTCDAINDMTVRGAGAIGAAAGYAMAQAFMEYAASNDSSLIDRARKAIESTRPTARNLFYAVGKVCDAGLTGALQAVNMAQKIADKDAQDSQRIGEYGNKLIPDGCRIATHCNAGWLAFVDFGTALSPVYKAHEEGKKVFVYADETRPRSQGARLTAWELHQAGIPHAIIPDNACAHLMSAGQIDIMIVGADRIAANGDTANKIGTLEKAIAAREFNIPFYIAAPTSTIDTSCKTGKEIRIEQRSEDEVLYQTGLTRSGNIEEILVASPGSRAINFAFDVTPARFITGIITENGIIEPGHAGMNT